MTSSLQRRVDRLDGGAFPARIEDWSIDQILRWASQGMEDPAAFLALSKDEQMRLLDEALQKIEADAEAKQSDR